jgi:hypothetical protein
MSVCQSTASSDPSHFSVLVLRLRLAAAGSDGSPVIDGVQVTSSHRVLRLLPHLVQQAEQRPGHLLGHCLPLLFQQLVELGLVRRDICLFVLILLLCLRAFLFEVCRRDGRVRGLAHNVISEVIDRRKQTGDTYLGVSTEQRAHGKSARGETLCFALPLDDVMFARLGFLLGILDGNVFAVVSLQDRSNVLGFVDADS